MSEPLRLLRWVGRGLRHLLSWPLALLILFEEWGWEPLQRALARLAQWQPLQRLEAWITTLRPGAALALFALPALALLPVKIGALWLIANGQRWLGLLIIVLAKVLGTALVARLFTLTRPALLRMPWFAKWYTAWAGWKNALVQVVRSTWLWRAGRLLRQRMKARWRQWRQPSS